MWELLQKCWEEVSEQYLISIVEGMPGVISAEGGSTSTSPKCRLHFVKQNASMIYCVFVLCFNSRVH